MLPAMAVAGLDNPSGGGEQAWKMFDVLEKKHQYLEDQQRWPALLVLALPPQMLSYPP